MTSKHTPGPWYWSHDYKTCDGRATWSLIGSDGYGILSCDGEENSPQGLNDGANARLIAAAPELLEALKAVLANSLDSKGLADAHKQARDAIAKATGGKA